MRRRYSTRLFRRVLVPLIHDTAHDAALTVALMIADAPHVMCTGIVVIPDGETLSAAALPARAVRATLRQLEDTRGIHGLGRIRVTHRPWTELLQVAEQEQPDLLILTTTQLAVFQMTAADALQNPPCDIIIAGGDFPEDPWMCSARCAADRMQNLHYGWAWQSHEQAMPVSRPSTFPQPRPLP